MNMRRGYADGPFGQVHYQRLGSGMPVVLLHQAPMTSGQFDRVYAPLAARSVHAIGIDLPGFGASDPTDFTPRVEDYARAVPSVLDALGIATAVVAGHHTGALIAVEVAAQFADRVAALVLHGPLLTTEEERQAWLTGRHLWEMQFGALPHGEHFQQLFRLREGFAAGSIKPERISQYVVQAQSGRGRYWYGHHAAYQYRLDLSLPRIAHPTLLLSNTGDMIHHLAARTRALRPDFSYVELGGGGIDIVDQQPDTWSTIVSAYARRIDETRQEPSTFNGEA